MSGLQQPEGWKFQRYAPAESVLSGLKKFTSLRLTRIKREIEDEVAHVMNRLVDSVPWYFDRQVHWLGITGHRMMHQLFPKIPDEVEGFHRCLDYVVTMMFYDNSMEVGKEVQRIWQYVWDDHVIAKYPSPYTTFIRDRILNSVPLEARSSYPLQVRESVIEIERWRTNKRLDKALLTPHRIPLQQVLNGVELAWLDVFDDQLHETSGRLSQKERAAFVLTMLMLGSRFKGVAVDNHIEKFEDAHVWLVGLSKSKDPRKSVRRPLNLRLAEGITSHRMPAFQTVFSMARNAYLRIKSDRTDTTKADTKATLNLMRKEVRRYIEQVFPGMLRPGEGTHLLRKIYLQLAFETFGDGMKETGFAASVFAHEGYNTSLHYTSVILT